MVFANVSMSDTWNTWRIRINEHVGFLNSFTSDNLFTIKSNSSSLIVSGNTQSHSNTVLSLVLSTNPNDNASANIASANLVSNVASKLSLNLSSQIANVSANLESSMDYVNTSFVSTMTYINATANSINSSFFPVAAPIYNQANAAYNQANAAYNQANTLFNNIGVANTTANGIVKLADTLRHTITVNSSDVLTSGALWKSSLFDNTAISNTGTKQSSSWVYSWNVAKMNPTLLLTTDIILSVTDLPEGQAGVIPVTQDLNGNHLMGYTSDWVFAGKVVPTMPVTANSTSLLYYQVYKAPVWSNSSNTYVTTKKIFGSLNNNLG